MSASGRPAASFPLSVVEREAAILAPYAMHSADTAGRRHAEPPHPYRGPFQRDRDRIVHSAAYRRLSGKTQVFTGELGDYHRTRLTHTLEVASIARTLARALALNEDLVEALALMHDLGHPPFGHAGEDVLDECLAAEGGFSHNAQALRIVEELETRYVEFPGLNLSAEVLAGQRVRADLADDGLRPLLEVQVVDAADSIAYDTHDADDALELGLVSVDELAGTALWSAAVARVRRRYAALDGPELRRAVLHELIDWQVGDLLDNTRRRLQESQPASAAAVRQAETIVVAGAELAQMKQRMEFFLHERVYRHASVMRHRVEAQQSLRQMWTGYRARPDLLPQRYRARGQSVGEGRSVGDYLAGMTDRYALAEFRRHFGGKPLD